ncbi:DUF3900 domain-containing protein [Chengkuizengella axinellae]|uniref:DUF3900 domain-containing protein n=1 Tax=Chengkuizengella axinellae TaxID=3064388 RepID=A0ABT9J1V0_9BACL|nr:DUF3900 domain-containing protein [Chengkuizengella sp. 2205SS18-9]MDP5275473.1 DUF3900 domain-containing protein [Chengkuizengella sp. 2205SS18-9]
MDFIIEYLSFFVIQNEEQDNAGNLSFRHFQTLDREEYQYSEIKGFLNEEYVRITKRKVEKHPKSEQTPTKIGYFIVEPGHELTSNPNYNLFQRLIFAENKQEYLDFSDELVRMYMDTSSVRGGALIISRARLDEYGDDPFLFIMKCDFEPKIARISDEKSLISQVEMAISAKNIKSIQYPYMPEPGISEEHELKIHQASHARYFEDFLKFVSYEKSMPEIMNEQMITMVNQYVEEKWQHKEGQIEQEERKKEEESLELWAASEKRELQQRWSHDKVMEAATQLVEQKEDIELKFKLDGIQVKGLLEQYGDQIHLAKLNGRYVVLIEGESFQFEKGVSPIELLHPDDFDSVLERLKTRNGSNNEHHSTNDEPPWDE